jgi:ABC-type multidrug transport system fused ATPase/permease subunit
MTEKLSMLDGLKRLWRQISRRRRTQFSLLLFLMIVTSLAEVFSIAAIIPFLGILTNPERIYELGIIKPLIETLGITKPADLLLPLTIIFSIAACVAGGMRLLLHWAGAKLSFGAGADLSIDIYRKTLYQPYLVHMSRNSSDIINSITTKTHQSILIITQVLGLLSSGVMIFAITAALIFIEPQTTLIAFSGFAVLYVGVVALTHRRLLLNSYNIAKNSTNVIKALQEGLSGIRDVLIDGTQEVYCAIYRSADWPLKRAQSDNSFIGVSPRYAMEALGMVLIAVVACGLATSQNGIVGAIPILGALALGAQRLLPLVQNIYINWSSVRGSQASLVDVLELLEQPLPEFANKRSPIIPIEFKKNITLKNVSFSYDKTDKYVLKNINIDIKKGSRIGFVGTTGSGKSTLLDIIMTLLIPDEGSIEVDGLPIDSLNPRAWQTHIAHVPQAIYLADTTIAENIAFGVPLVEIDFDRVVRASELAQISETINKMADSYQTIVGERGMRLSGGQRQRIGIARALYKNADVIIFDEATSALDSETEQAVIESINSLSTELTILIIAHRVTSVKDCSVIYRVENGTVVVDNSSAAV